MNEDLKRANDGFMKLLDEAKRKKDFKRFLPDTPEADTLLYFFYLAGFCEGTGMTQTIA